MYNHAQIKMTLRYLHFTFYKAYVIAFPLL